MATKPPATVTDVNHLLRKPDPQLRYPVHARWADFTSGRSDGRADLGRLGGIGTGKEGTTLDADSSMYLARLTHMRQERIEHEVLTLKAVTVRERIRLETVGHEITEIERLLVPAHEALAEAHAAHRRLADTADDQLQRGPAETNTPCADRTDAPCA